MPDDRERPYTRSEQPAYPTVSASPGEVTERLGIFCSHPAHTFWPDGVSLMDGARVDVSKIQGHRQLTDLYLAGLAVHHLGKLATFDTRIPIVGLINPPADILEIIPTV